MRNNQARFGGQAHPGAVPQQDPPSPGLAYVVPTEFVELPSRGIFYPDGHPLQNQETIEVKFMTAKDEDILSSTALIKKGLVIDRLLGNLIIDTAIDPKDLLIGDRNAIMIAARISSYGSHYEVGIGCPQCLREVEYAFDLKKTNLNEDFFNEEFLKSNKVEFNSSLGAFEILLPTSEKTVSVKMLTGYSEKNPNNEGEDEESTVTTTLSSFIVAVEQNTDPITVQQFIENMPASDSRYLRKLYPQLMPDIDLKQEFICEKCGDKRDLEVPLTSAFFWPE